MKEIIDTIVIILFIFILFMILKGFNKQQIEKHKNMLDEKDQKRENNDQTTTN